MNIYFEGLLNKNSTGTVRTSCIIVHAQMVFKFLSCLVKEKNYYEVSACFFENTCVLTF
jgi:hypothetical protein